MKLAIDVVHIEADLRSFDRSMPEEINRIVTDAISDLLLVSEESGQVNLLQRSATVSGPSGRKSDDRLASASS